MKTAQRVENETIRVERRPAFRIAGLVRRYPATPEAMQALGQQWMELAHGPAGALLANGPVMYGIHVGLFGDSGEDEYTSGVEIGASEKIPAGLIELRIPALDYAVIQHTGLVSEISLTTSDFLVNRLPAFSYRLAGARPLDLIERYGKNFDPAKGAGDIELLIPVEA
jgi:predicted transcriptional regulator YdeE